MTLIHIHARFECDGCSRKMEVPMDPARIVRMCTPTIMDLAIDAVRGGTSYDVPNDRRTLLTDKSCSVQFDKVLCGDCTTIADAMEPAPKSWEEIEELL